MLPTTSRHGKHTCFSLGELTCQAYGTQGGANSGNRCYLRGCHVNKSYSASSNYNCIGFTVDYKSQFISLLIN